MRFTRNSVYFAIFHSLNRLSAVRRLSLQRRKARRGFCICAEKDAAQQLMGRETSTLRIIRWEPEGKEEHLYIVKPDTE